jgi:hypothetical protein
MTTFRFVGWIAAGNPPLTGDKVAAGYAFG